MLSTLRRAPALALLLLASALPAAAQNARRPSAAAMDAFNFELQETYDRLRPALEARLQQEAAAQLGGFKKAEPNYEVEVTRYHGLRLRIDGAPGMRTLTTDRLELSLPLRGSWALEAEADVIVRARLGFLRPSIKLERLRLIVDELQVRSAVAIDDSDPTRPQVRRLERPRVEFRVRVRSKGLFTGLLVRLLSPIGNLLAHRALGNALDDLMPRLAALNGLPGPIPGDGAAPLVDSGAPTPFLEVVENVERKIRRDHLPHGTLLMMRMDVPASDSWEDAYRNGGPGNPGVASPGGDGGDSAIWTGHYLTAQAFRYHATGAPEALDAIRHTLTGIGALLEVNGDTGLLARVAAPAASPMGQEIMRQARHARRSMRGEDWVGTQGGNGISRDQYMGVFMGLMLTHDLVAEPAVQAECSRRIQQMLDYLIGHAWYIDEDRPAVDLTAGGGFPTFYTGIPYQRLNYLLMGRRLAPGKYDAELARWAPLTETAWVGEWISTFNLDSYYKFNLTHGTFYNYFRLETDPGRWQDMARGFHIVRRFVGHHHNPHFQLVHAAVDPSLRAALHPASKEALRQFLRRNHREVSPPNLDLSRVTWSTFTLPNVALPGQQPRPAQMQLPSEPLEIVLRAPAGDFLWQRSAFHLAQPGHGDPHLEAHGLDLVLPYWMGRHHGAF